MARTRGRGGGEAGGNKGRGGTEACLKTNRGIRLIGGTRDFIAGLINQSSAIGRFLFGVGRKRIREMGIGLTCL
jgi:hypothetical protein